jgi:hypothetical protein
MTDQQTSIPRSDSGSRNLRFLVYSAIIAAIVSESLLPGLLNAQAFQGYTLYSKMDSKNTYLLNMNNAVAHSWSHVRSGGYSCYLLSDGSLLRPALSTNSNLNGGGQAGIVERVSWTGTTLWEFTYSSNTYRTHHDLEPMPNGNVLCIAWEVKTAAQCVAAGLDHSATLWFDHIIEVQPTGPTSGNIVWEWHGWDHLIQDYSSSKANYGVVGDHPELLDINAGYVNSGDWMHINAVSYNPTLDQIVISSHFLNEVYVIDHSTTTAQAATHTGGNGGKGGDFLYRWGNPANYRAAGTKVFDVVHCAWWVPTGLSGAGDIMAFNNRQTTGQSMIVQITPPPGYSYTPNTAWGPASPTWSYTASGFFSNHLGGNQRLPNGNTIIAEATSGYLFEVNSAGAVQWSYQTTGQIPRVLRYDPNYPGLSALVDVEMMAFEANPNGDIVDLTWTVASETSNEGFEVQRSLDGGQIWAAIGFVPGRGTTNTSHDYSFSDSVTTSMRSVSIVSYRLRQVDTDGSETFTKAVDVAIDAAPLALRLMRNYPNPFDYSTTVDYYLAKDAMVSLKVYDMHGREVATLADAEITAGSHSVKWDPRDAPAGMYLCRLISGNDVRTMRIVYMGPGK